MDERPSFARQVLLAALAVVLLFEEWGWEPLQAALARLARLPVLRRVEAWISGLGPWASLMLFTLPVLVLFPAKLLALWLMANGQALLGLAALLVAKALGTALVARIFTLTQPTLMQLPWFARTWPRWKAWKDGVLAQARGSAPWRALARMRAALRLRWVRWRASGRGPGR